MGMTTSITKTPATIGAIACPGKHLLFLTIKNSFANKRVIAMGAIATRKFAIFVNQSFGRRKCAKDWSNAFHLGPESHVVIPFILGFERVYTPGNRVIFSKLRITKAPVWIDRPVGFKITTDPIKKFIPILALGSFYPVVKHCKSYTLLGEGINFFKVSIIRVTATPIAVNTYAICGIEDGFIRGPAI